MHRSRPLARHTLAFTFWPDVSEAEARSNLRRHLYELRRALPPENPERPWLLTENSTVQWNAQAEFWLDVDQFVQQSASPTGLAEAVALYQGNLLPGYDEEWLFFERERLRNLFFDNLMKLIAQHRAQLAYPKAIAYAQQLLTHDPLREDGVRELMTLRHAHGDRAGALQEYRRFAQAVRQELGVEPMAETQALFAQLSRQTATPPPLPPPADPPAARPVQVETSGEVSAAAAQLADVLLLSTKLFAPQPSPALVTRPRLYAKLEQALRSRLLLISAPAGWGKSALVSAWAAQWRQGAANNQVAWLALDSDDNDLARFFLYLLGALRTFHRQLGQALLLLLQSSKPPPPKSVITLLVNSFLETVSASGLPEAGHFLLVLDDYHLIENPAIQEAVAFLVEQLPPQLHLVILSRSDPPLPLARWRVRGLLAEVRASDLRFTEAEAHTFLQQIVGAPLSPAEVTALAERTEGWVAGLQLAALSLQGVADRQEFIRAFGGSHRYVLDYLVEEVLEREPPALQAFLLQSALLDRFCAPLCHAVVSSPESRTAAEVQALIETVERRNLFLVPLDNERRWYRYHQLFGDALRNRLQRDDPSQLPVYYSRASRWCQAHHLPHEAIAYAFAADDLKLAAQLIETEAPHSMQSGRHKTVQSWLERLPIEQRQRRPQLCLVAATIHVITQQIDQAEAALAQVAQQLPQLPAAQATVLAAEIAAIRTGIALNRGQQAEVITLAQQALASLPAERQALRAEVTLHYGLALSFLGQSRAAEQAYREAERLALAAGDLRTALLAMANQGAQLHGQGQLRRAVEQYEAVLRTARQHQVEQMPSLAFVYQLLGDIYFEWNQLTTAQTYLQTAREHCERNDLFRTLVSTDTLLARLHYARGERAAAHQTINQALTVATRAQLPPRYAGPLAALQARFWLHEGNLPATQQWAATCGVSATDQTLLLLYEEAYTALARLLHQQGQTDAALTLLDRYQQMVVAEARQNSVITIATLQAVLYAASAQPAKASACLWQAVTLAQPAGYVRIFVEEGEPLRLLLVKLRAAHLPALDQRNQQAVLTYLDTLIAAFPATASQPLPITQRTAANQALVEPLSTREQEVLQMIAQGLSDRQIAERLILALGTVKKHINTLYGKLGVSSRVQALTHAQAVGLL